MNDSRWIAYFRNAVLLTLALPACGGTTTLTPVPDAGEGPDATVLPGTPCNWAAGPRAKCDWTLTFTGDPTKCAGFAGTGTLAQCLAVCGLAETGQAPDFCSVYGADGGPQTLECQANTGACQPVIPPGNGGRRPGYFAALGFSAAAPGREVGAHFARVACMEAGSVEAFRWLRDELRAHGAPARLIDAVRRAVRDEIRHVRQTSALARRFGEEPIAPHASVSRPVRPLVDMALENAVEGCIRETYSALECAWQAEVAQDPVVRAVMTRIARDEMRHLALAWSVHAWVMGRLDSAERARIRAAQRAEIAMLLGELAEDPNESLVRTAGLPRADQSRELVGAIAARLAA